MRTATKADVDALGRALCDFLGLDPSQRMTAAGGTALDHVVSYQVPKVALSLGVRLPTSNEPGASQCSNSPSPPGIAFGPDFDR
jgi:hypothetical protein